MPDTIKWEENSKKKFDEMINKMPLFHREIANQVVTKKAISNAKERKSETVEEGDIVRAFLTEVPKAFYSLMIKLMDNVGFDHNKVERELK